MGAAARERVVRTATWPRKAEAMTGLFRSVLGAD